MLKREGKVYTVVENNKTNTLLPVITKKIMPDRVVNAATNNFIYKNTSPLALLSESFPLGKIPLKLNPLGDFPYAFSFLRFSCDCLTYTLKLLQYVCRFRRNVP